MFNWLFNAWERGNAVTNLMNLEGRWENMLPVAGT